MDPNKLTKALGKCVPIRNCQSRIPPLRSRVAVDPAEQDGEQSLKKSYIRNKMDPTSTCVDAVLRALAAGDRRRWSSVVVGLDFLKTFLTFTPQWSAVEGEDAGKHLRDLPSRIEDEFEKIEWEIEKAGATQDPDALRSRLIEKIDHFKPLIRGAYDFLLEYALQTPHPPVISGTRVWFRLYGSLLSNCQNLHSVSSLSDPLYKRFERILKFLQAIQLREVIFRYPDKFRDLGTQHGGVSLCFAGLLFLWWVGGERGDGAERNLTAKVSDLLQRIKPATPSLMAMYFKVIKSQPHSLQKTLMEELAGITLLVPDESLEALRGTLEFLIMRRLVESKSPDNRSRDEEIEKVIWDAAALSDYDALALGQLLQKAELLRIESLLIELGESDAVSRTRFESHYQGVKFHDAYPEKTMLILQQIENLTRGAQPLNPSSYDKVSLDFSLTVIQALLMELMSCSPGLIVRVKDQIQTLSEGSELFHKYSSILPLENPSDMDLISTFMSAAVKEAETLHDFCASTRVTEQNIEDMSQLLSKFLEQFNRLNTKIKETYLQFRGSSMLSFPKTLPGLGFVDSFLERLSELTMSKTCSDGYSIKHQTEAVLTELNSLRPFLKQVGVKQNENSELKDLQRRVTLAAYQADYILDSIHLCNADGCHLLWLSDVIDEMKLVKEDLIKYFEMNKGFAAKVQNVVQTSGLRTTQTDAQEVGEIIVSLDDQEKEIIERLIKGEPRRCIVGIVGMAGIGKTTLAKKVYGNPDVKKHFQRLAWCCISHDYRKREVLLEILSDIAKTIEVVGDESDEELVQMLKKSHDKRDSELLDRLRRSLLGKRYLIVIDDVWGERAWEDLGMGFPKESHGSRILFTSRSENALSYEEDRALHHPRLLEDEESWKLLEKKVFQEGKCPEKLAKVGRVIARNCRGLPLAVVTIAGLLSKTEKEADRWSQITKGLNLVEDPQSQCNKVLELSYNYLPHDLKPCFLYFAAFREDMEVSVKKLIRLWIAEGFIRKVDDQNATEDVAEDYVDQKAAEDVAEDYVEDLIGRSLIMAAKKGPSNRAKACKIHDLLHKLCLAKVKEENFLESITGYENHYPANAADYGPDLEPTSKSIACGKHRLRISSKRNQFVKLEPCGHPVRTLLFSATSDSHPTCPYDVSFIPRNFQLLKVLDIESINMGPSFPAGIHLLDPLRYLAVSGDIDSVPSTIANLWNLETFIVKGLRGKVALPSTIWSMSRLRHFHVSPRATFNLQDENHESSSRLDDLVTLSSPVLSLCEDTEKMMKKFPELKELSCIFSPAQHCRPILVLDFLTKLESLKILYNGVSGQSCELNLPFNLKKLSLSHFSFTWNSFSSIGALPKLEVLSLHSIAFDSTTWEMDGEEFSELRILKLDSLKLVEWIVPRYPLPSLEQLVLRKCKDLQAVPPEFGDITTLQVIELMWCSTSAEDSLAPIKKQQLEVVQKKEGFKTIVNDPAAGFRSSL